MFTCRYGRCRSLSFAYLVAAQELRWSAVRQEFGWRWVRTDLLPLLLANQFVWVPAVTFIYLLPLGFAAADPKSRFALLVVSCARRIGQAFLSAQTAKK